MSEFFYMGGYGGFIWPAYGVTVLGLGAAIIWIWSAWRSAKAKLARLENAKGKF